MIVKKARKRYGQVIQPWLQRKRIHCICMILSYTFAVVVTRRRHWDRNCSCRTRMELKFGGRRTSFLQVRVV